MSNIVLKLEHRRAIAQQGEAAYPLECRGLLLGHRDGLTIQVVDILFNGESLQPESLESRFHYTSQEIQEGEKIAIARGLEFLGSFHSFVNSPARPTANDRQSAQPTISYVIVGIRNGRAHELTAWTLSEDRTAFYQETMRSL